MKMTTHAGILVTPELRGKIHVYVGDMDNY